VRFNVVFDRVLRVVGGMDVVTVRQVRVVGGLFVIPRLVMRGGFVVVARSVFQMLCCLRVMTGCFVGHGNPPNNFKNRAS
jgi:hypothetical protein